MNEKFEEIGIGGVFAHRPLTDLLPNCATGYPSTVVNRPDDLEVERGKCANPINKHSDHIVTRHRGCSRIRQDISDEHALIFALCASPLSKSLFQDRLIFPAFNALRYPLVVEIESSHYLNHCLLLFPALVSEHLHPVLDEAIFFFLLPFRP